MRRIPDHRAVVTLSAAALGGLALLVRSGLTHDLDRTILATVQATASGPLDLAANVHTLVGLPLTTLLVACAASAWLWRAGRGLESLAPLLLVATVAVELALKLTTGHAQPPAELTRVFIEPIGPRVETPSSFPSGHAARLTFLALLGALVAGGRVAAVGAAIFVAFTLFARVYIGDHWPTDVLGGFALGTAFAVTAADWMRGTDRRS